LLALISWNTWAALVDIDPDWQETDAPPPPAFSRDKLIPVDMPLYVTLKLGVDPSTLTITSDGVVRYVMVASSTSGSFTAMYEGIRCLTGEVKLYARFSASGQWRAVDNPQWRPLNDNQPSPHALALARQGACDGRSAAAASTAAIVQRLLNPNRDRIIKNRPD
jgi:hypothetical protein